MEHNQIVRNEARRIVDTYTLPNNYRIKITTYHDRERKVYWSYIAEAIVNPSGTSGIVFERSTSEHLHRLLSSVKGLRFSAKDLHAAHANALQLGAELRDQHLADNKDKELVNA